MSPRGAAFLAVVVLIGLGGFAGWLVGVPVPVIAVGGGLVFLIALGRVLTRPRAPQPGDGSKPP
ncbi:MAG: hypothetical protein ACT4P7_05825 [Gemmatimonadaceae bacterium]